MTSPELLVARGLSAGGLLMGATSFLAPELFRAIVAEVPFVDVVNTMLDDTLPLTVAEWDEWGDPREPDDYAYMQGYSPYDNLPGPQPAGAARDRQPARPPGQRARAGQVGGEDAGRRQPGRRGAAAADRAGRRGAHRSGGAL